MLVKYYGGEPQASEDDLRVELEVGGLEREGYFRFAYEPGGIGPGRRAVSWTRRQRADARCGPASTGTERLDLDEALRQQDALGEIVRGAQLVVKTAVLEDTAEAWTLKEQRKAQEAHSGTIWLTARGLLALSRVTPLPMD